MYPIFYVNYNMYQFPMLENYQLVPIQFQDTSSPASTLIASRKKQNSITPINVETSKNISKETSANSDVLKSTENKTIELDFLTHSTDTIASELKSMIMTTKIENIEKVFDFLSNDSNFLTLSTHYAGTRVIQDAIEYFNIQQKEKLIEICKNEIIKYIYSKHANFVIYKLIVESNTILVEKFAGYLLQYNIKSIACDQYGCRIFRAIFQTSTTETNILNLIYIIISQSQHIFNSRYGHHVITYLITFGTINQIMSVCTMLCNDIKLYVRGNGFYIISEIFNCSIFDKYYDVIKYLAHGILHDKYFTEIKCIEFKEYYVLNSLLDAVYYITELKDELITFLNTNHNTIKMSRHGKRLLEKIDKLDYI